MVVVVVVVDILEVMVVINLKNVVIYNMDKVEDHIIVVKIKLINLVNIKNQVKLLLHY
jgi:hypothetical protein